jgi:hypothetical protein
MAVNWTLGLQQGPNAGEQFAGAFQQGQERAKQNKGRAALAALVRDPNNQGALAALAEVDPQSAMQFREQQQKQAMAGLEQHREAIKIGAAIIRQVNPRDQAGWDQALNATRQYGIDPAALGVPPQFQPEYAQQIVSLADALDPQRAQQPRLVPFTQGGGVLQVNPDGTRNVLIQPNEGNAPAGGLVAQPLTDEDIMRLEGGQSGAPAGGFLGPY